MNQKINQNIKIFICIYCIVSNPGVTTSINEMGHAWVTEDVLLLTLDYSNSDKFSKVYDEFGHT